MIHATVHAGKPRTIKMTLNSMSRTSQATRTICAEVCSVHVRLHAHIREGDADSGAQTDGRGAHTPVGAVQPRCDVRHVRHHRHQSCERNACEQMLVHHSDPCACVKDRD